MAVKYDENLNYKQLMDEAVAKGDYATAAKYEQARNAKISDLNATGANKWNATQSTDYAQYLGAGYTPAGTNTDSNMSAEDLAKLNDYKSQYYNAVSLDDRDTANAMHLAAEALREGYGYSGGDDGSEYIALGTTPADTGKPTYDYSSIEASKPTFESSYSAQIDALLNQILNRDAFSYDAASDPLYQQYLSQYNREGTRAMNDTLAAAASNAGGMNSYAITAAQQANNYYASQAEDKIPELYELAYQMYLDGIDLDMQEMGLVTQLDDTQYNRYRDTMSDWRNDRDFSYGMYRDDVGDWQWQTNFDYNVGRDQIADSRYDQEWEYNVGRDQISDSRYENEWNYGVGQDAKNDAYERAMELLASGAMPTEQQLADAGITKEQAMAIYAAGGFSASGSTGNTGTTGGNGGSYVGGYSAPEGWTRDDIIKFQTENGLSPDGIWGPESEKAYQGKNNNKDLLGNTEPEDQEDDGIDRDLNYAMMRLGLGPVSATVLTEMMQYGGIVETSNGFEWANGWNANNYQEKLNQAKAGAFGGGFQLRV